MRRRGGSPFVEQGRLAAAGVRSPFPGLAFRHVDAVSPRVLAPRRKRRSGRDRWGPHSSWNWPHERAGISFRFALDRSKNQPGVEILRVVRSMPFEVDPFPRQLALNGEATLSGELAWRRSSEETRIISDVTMEVCNSDGRFDSFSFPDGTSFRQRIRC